MMRLAQSRRGERMTLQRPIDTRSRRPRSPGFTLIELLLVLVILATLAAIVVPRFTGRSKQARVTAAEAEISSLGAAISMFEIETGRLPTTDEGLKALVEKPGNAEGWRGPYLERQGVPKDPWGNDYIYTEPGTHNTHGYDLYSVGPDAKQGGGDDIDNWSER